MGKFSQGLWRQLRSVAGFGDDPVGNYVVADVTAAVQLSHPEGGPFQSRLIFTVTFLDVLGDPILPEAGTGFFSASLLEVFIVRDVEGSVVSPPRRMISSSIKREGLRGYQKVIGEEFEGAEQVFLLLTDIDPPPSATDYEIHFRGDVR